MGNLVKISVETVEIFKVRQASTYVYVLVKISLGIVSYLRPTFQKKKSFYAWFVSGWLNLALAGCHGYWHELIAKIANVCSVLMSKVIEQENLDELLKICLLSFHLHGVKIAIRFQKFIESLTSCSFCILYFELKITIRFSREMYCEWWFTLCLVRCKWVSGSKNWRIRRILTQFHFFFICYYYYYFITSENQMILNIFVAVGLHITKFGCVKECYDGWCIAVSKCAPLNV